MKQRNNICRFTNNYYVCVTLASDEFYYGNISNWDANLQTSELVISDNNGTNAIPAPEGNVLQLFSGKYKRITEGEADQIVNEFVMDESADQFININSVGQWEGK